MRHASGTIERLNRGLPRINSAVSYQFGSATLAAGDLLLIFTDGLVEAEDDGSASTVNNECYRWCKRSTAVPRKR